VIGMGREERRAAVTKGAVRAFALGEACLGRGREQREEWDPGEAIDVETAWCVAAVAGVR